MGSESGKEAEVPGLRGPVPELLVGPTWGVTSGRAAPRMPPVRSARGPRPAAAAAPRTRRAALVTGGGGRGDPAGLGIGRPGGREAGGRPAAAALDLSLLSIQHLTKKQINQHPRSWIAMLPARLWVLEPLCSFSCVTNHGRPNLCLDPLPSTHPPLTSSPAQLLTVVPKPRPYRLSSRPRLPLLPLRTRDQPTYPSPSQGLDHQRRARELPQVPDEGMSTRPDPLASPQSSPGPPGEMPAPAGRRSGPGCPRTGLRRQRAAFRARPPAPAGPWSASPFHLLAPLLTSGFGLPPLHAGSPGVGPGGSAAAVAAEARRGEGAAGGGAVRRARPLAAGGVEGGACAGCRPGRRRRERAELSGEGGARGM